MSDNPIIPDVGGPTPSTVPRPTTTTIAPPSTTTAPPPPTTQPAPTTTQPAVAPRPSVPMPTFVFDIPANRIDPAKSFVLDSSPEGILAARRKMADVLRKETNLSAGVVYGVAMMLPVELLNETTFPLLDLRPILAQFMSVLEAHPNGMLVTANGTQTFLEGQDLAKLEKEIDAQTKAAVESARTIGTNLGLTGAELEKFVADAESGWEDNPLTVDMWKSTNDATYMAEIEAKAKARADNPGVQVDYATSEEQAMASLNLQPLFDWTIEGLQVIEASGGDFWAAVTERETKYKDARAQFAAEGLTAPGEFNPLEVNLQGMGFTNLPPGMSYGDMRARENGDTERLMPSKSVSPVRINEALTWMLTGKSAEQVKAVRGKLIDAGFLADETGSGRLVGVWDDTAQQAWRSLLKDAMTQKVDPAKLLADRIMARSEATKIRGGTDPAALRFQANGLAQAILGRDLTTSEHLAVRQHLMSLAQEQQDNALAGKEYFAVDEKQSTAEFLRNRNADEARKVGRFGAALNAQEALGNKVRRPNLTREQEQEVMQQAVSNGWTADRTFQYVIEKYAMGWEV